MRRCPSIVWASDLEATVASGMAIDLTLTPTLTLTFTLTLILTLTLT